MDTLRAYLRAVADLADMPDPITDTPSPQGEPACARTLIGCLERSRRTRGVPVLLPSHALAPPF